MYVLYLFAPIAVLGILLTGGIRRSLRGGTGWMWTAFLGWMILAVPTSTWRGGSVEHVKSYMKTELLMFFMIAGLTLTWVECRRVIYTIAAAGAVNVAWGKLFLAQSDDRFQLAYGTSIANSNDFAAHLLLVLPFILFFGVKKGRRLLWRLAAAAALAYGMYLVLGTASRGALIALAVLGVFVFLKGSLAQRLTAAALVPVAALILFLALPDRTTQRLLTFSGDVRGDQEAVESGQLRRYLLLQSLRYTLKFPIFGVGPGQFPTYEGSNNQVIGDHGHWRPTHNLLTQVSSECGIPGFLFFSAALIFTYRRFNGVYRQARRNSQHQEMALAAFCGLLAFIGFGTAAVFLNLAYRFYLPALSGLAVAMAAAAAREFAAGASGAAAVQPHPGQAPGVVGWGIQPGGQGQSPGEKKYAQGTPRHFALNSLGETERPSGRLKRRESGASVRESGRS